MKISFITTVYNEESTIENLLESLNSQLVIPDEVIIVDAKSSDQTVDKIKVFNGLKSCKLKIKIIEKQGNRSVGRNKAIELSSGEIIVCSDAGCVLDINWVKKLVEHFSDSNTDVVSGFYNPIGDSVFQKCLATYTCTMPDKVDSKSFLPSSRSIAFKKKAWEKVKGYPEWLDTCEDLYFARELKRNKLNFKFAKDAIVYWPQRENLKEAYSQFINYAKGDGKARYFRKNTPFLFLRYFLGICLFVIFLKTFSILMFFLIVILFVAYLIWAIQKNYKYVNNIKAFIYLPLLQFCSDFAVLTGTTVGLLKSFAIKK